MSPRLAPGCWHCWRSAQVLVTPDTAHIVWVRGAGGLSTLNTGSRCHGLDARHCTGAWVGQPSPGHEVTGSSGRGRSLHQPREATWTSVGTRPGQHGQHGHHGHPRGQASTRLVIRIDSCDRDGQLDKNQYCCEKVCSRLGCALTAEQWAVSPLHPAPPRPAPAPLTRRAFKVGQGRYWCWAGRGGLTQSRIDAGLAVAGGWLVPPRPAMIDIRVEEPGRAAHCEGAAAAAGTWPGASQPPTLPGAPRQAAPPPGTRTAARESKKAKTLARPSAAQDHCWRWSWLCTA